MAGGEWCSLDSGSVIAEPRRQNLWWMLLPRRAVELIFMGRRERRGWRKDGRKDWKVKSLKERKVICRFVSWDCTRLAAAQVALGGCTLFIKTIYWLEWSRRQHDVKYSVIKRRSQYRWTQRQPPLSCLCLFLFVFLNILICASVYVKRKKGEGFVSVQKLSMIHVSSALICELCTAPG